MPQPFRHEQPLPRSVVVDNVTLLIYAAESQPFSRVLPHAVMVDRAPFGVTVTPMRSLKLF